VTTRAGARARAHSPNIDHIDLSVPQYDKIYCTVRIVDRERIHARSSADRPRDATRFLTRARRDARARAVSIARDGEKTSASIARSNHARARESERAVNERRRLERARIGTTRRIFPARRAGADARARGRERDARTVENNPARGCRAR
jgi:hypothetical protein